MSWRDPMGRQVHAEGAGALRLTATWEDMCQMKSIIVCMRLHVCFVHVQLATGRWVV